MYVGGRLLWRTIAVDLGLMLASAELGICRFSCGDGVAATVGPALAVSIRN